MNKKEFYKDKNNKIKRIITALEIIKMPVSHHHPIPDHDMSWLIKLANELTKQVHELNAGRNIFVDNDKDKTKEGK